MVYSLLYKTSLFYSSSENSAHGHSCLFLGKKTLRRWLLAEPLWGYQLHISYMPMLVSALLEIPFLWAEGELRRQQDSEVLDTAKLALRVQPSSHGSAIVLSFFLP